MTTIACPGSQRFRWEGDFRGYAFWKSDASKAAWREAAAGLAEALIELHDTTDCATGCHEPIWRVIRRDVSVYECENLWWTAGIVARCKSRAWYDVIGTCLAITLEELIGVEGAPDAD